MIQFGIWFPVRERAQAAADALAAEGYTTELQESGSEWVVSATTDRLSAERSLADASGRMAEIAATFGGEYLGHGGLIGWGATPG